MKFVEVLKKHQLADRVSGECIKDLQECEDLQEQVIPVKERPYVRPGPVKTGRAPKPVAAPQPPPVQRTAPTRKKVATRDN